MRLPFRTAKEPAGRTMRRREKYGAHGSGAKNSRTTVVPHTAGENEAAGREPHDVPNDEPVPETADVFPYASARTKPDAATEGARPVRDSSLSRIPSGQERGSGNTGRATGSLSFPRSLIRPYRAQPDRKSPPCRLYRHGGKRSTGSEHQSKATMRTSSSGVSIRTVIVSSGSRLSTFSGHSTRQRFPL